MTAASRPEPSSSPFNGPSDEEALNEIEMEARPLLSERAETVLGTGEVDRGVVSDTEEEFSLPPPANCKQQLKAMLHRQWLLKKRGWMQTTVELVSPLLMMSLLVLAYHLSDVEYYEAHIFANMTLPVMDRLVEASSHPETLASTCPALHRFRGVTNPSQVISALASLQQRLEAQGLIPPNLPPGVPPNFPEGASSLPNITAEQASGAVSAALAEAGLAGGLAPPGLGLALLSCLELGQSARDLRHSYYAYHGPIPLPTFDAYVMAHKLLRQTLEAEGGYEKILELQAKLGNQLGNLLTLGRISFAPNTTEVQGLVQHLSQTSQFFDDVFVGTYPSEAAAVKAAMGPFGSEMWAVVVVEKLDLITLDIDYTLRLNYTTMPRTYKIMHKWSHSVHNDYKRYFTSGYLSIQNAINDYVFHEAEKRGVRAKEKFLPEVVWSTPMPVGEYKRNPFYDAVGPLLGLVMCLCTLYPLGMLVKALVEEKETRSKETMRIMGLRLWVFDLSWFLTYAAVFAVISFTVTVTMCSTFFPRSSPSLVFTLFLLFTISLIPFGFFVSVFFSKSKLAAVAAPFAHFAAILPRYVFFRSGEGQAVSGKTAACLLPPTAFTFGVDLLGQYEGAFMGLGWAEVADDEFPMSTLLAMLLADFFIYAALAWYLEQVLPSEYGSQQTFWFPLSRAYWMGDSWHPNQSPSLIAALPNAGVSSDAVEPVDAEGMKRAVHISGLRKVYPGGKTAVDGLDLSVYEGQITALLGHNGAGKSTTISMLTGLIRPTGGDAQIWGRSIRGSMDAVRRVIGVCPQHNVLFSRLTVREHLELYAALKGVTEEETGAAVAEMISALGLKDKTDTLSAALSGGMKRKLQVALALIGGSKVVFLDEPTSGMDPHARRAMWELLRKFKSGRAVVLTTHYMDEADLLCDRIAIMSEGRLRCCGTSLFLKARYGVGYNLTMTKAEADCSQADVAALVRRHVASAVPLSSAGGEIAFQLPLSEKGAFALLFAELESRRAELKIGGYGVSMTTLEEVFLRLAREGTAPVPKPQVLPIGHPVRGANGPSGGGGAFTHLADPAASAQEATSAELTSHDPPSEPASSAESADKGAESASKGYYRVASRPEEERSRGVGVANGVPVDLEGGRRGAGRLRRQRSWMAENRSFGRAWTELFKKRAIIARRDIKALLNMALLPVGVIAFVLLILRVTIDPAGPSLALNFEMFTKLSKSRPAEEPVPVSGFSQEQSLALFGRKGVQLEEASGVQTSMDMSWELLRILNTGPARFGALVYNDVLWQSYNLSALASSALPADDTLPGSTFPQYNLPPETNLSALLNRLAPFSDLAPSLPGPIGSALASLLNRTSRFSTPQELVNSSLVGGAAEGYFGGLGVANVTNGRGLPVALTLLHNTSSDHALAALVAELAQAQLRLVANRSDARLVARSHPLPLTQEESIRIQTFLTVLAALFVLIPFCYMAATFAVFVVRETAIKAKHLQLVSGASVLAYWSATYVWDMLVYTAIAAVTMVVFALYHDTALIGSWIKVVGIFALLVFFGAAVIPLSYVYSFAFTNFASAQVGIAGLHFITGFVMVVASFVMGEIDKTKELNKVLVWVYRCFPPFNFGQGLISLSALDFRAEISGKTVSPFEWGILGRPLLFLFVEAFAFFALTVAIDRDIPAEAWRRLLRALQKVLVGDKTFIRGSQISNKPPQEDADVARERKRVQEGLAEDDAVLVTGLKKVYPNGKTAVVDLCLGIPSGECFGFLGVNGAGKTTTLAILTGDLRPTGGEAFVNGYSVLSELPAVQRQIGYCPQFDPLLDLMTGREQLTMYARLKGVAERRVAGIVEDTIQAVGLDKYADRVSGAYSGGNKRKLSLAIALVGDPAAVLLDEPSSGMDPVARRAMWDIISAATERTGACVLLTTHSMVECEALCGRVGVMVAGRLVCLGSIQHLKTRFGLGYHLEVKTASASTSRLHEFVQSAFAGAVLEEEHSGRAKYRLPMAGLSLSKVFGAIEACKDELSIDDYSVSQATLEQIFLSFAKGENERAGADTED